MASVVRAVRSGDIKLIDAELRKPVRQTKNDTFAFEALKLQNEYIFY